MNGLFKYFPVDLYKLENLVRHQIQLTPPKFGIAVKVAYEANLKRLKADFSNPIEVYFTKHQKWGHENEWRVVEFLARAFPEPRNGKTFYLLGFKPKYLVRVILGLRVDPEVKNRLSEMLDMKEFGHVKIERMTIDALS